MNKEFKNQFNKTIKAAKSVEKCEIKFCEKERIESQKKAALMQKEMMKLMSTKPSTKSASDTLLEKMKKIKSDFYESKESKDLGICALEKCKKELKKSFRELVNMYKIVKTPQSQQKYTEGKKILDNDLNIKSYVNFLKVTL